MRAKLVFVYGTRPEAIKLGPIVALLPDSLCISTGQHQELLKGSPANQDLSNSVSLGLESHGDVAKWITQAVPVLVEELKRLSPEIVVVQGDTMSAYAGAIAASSLGIPLAHVEAGLRSHTLDEPWPEEKIRRAISLRANWHFCPTLTSRQNLLEEGTRDHEIFVTGNPVVSAIARYSSLDPVEIPKNQIFVTMHRREWTDSGRALVLKTVFALFQQALKYPDIDFLWPLHPGVAKILGADITETPENVFLVAPLAYQETIKQLKVSIGVATDSGGLQEEAATLGVPCAVLRNVSDRPESIEAGIAKLFCPGPIGMKEAIKCLVSRELPRDPQPCFGTKDSASKIATQLQALVTES